MIDKLKEEIEKLVGREIEKCVKEHGLFNSPHEGFAVIQEEVEEAGEDLQAIKIYLGEAWKNVRTDTFNESNLKWIREYAILLACEAIQIAAVSAKYIESFKEGKR